MKYTVYVISMDFVLSFFFVTGLNDFTYIDNWMEIYFLLYRKLFGITRRK